MPRSLKEFYFTIDLRSLGLYRILLAGLLIFDWILRWPDLEAFYTSFGALPVEAPLPKSGGEFHFCLLDGVSSLPMVQAVFCAGLVFYLFFLVGYRTRTFQALSFVFFISVLSRNVMIRDGSVVVLATMLMWSLFLPLGNRFSLDTWLSRIRTDQGSRSKTTLPSGVSPDGAPRRPRPASLRSKADGIDQPLVVTRQACAPSFAAFAIVAQIGLIYFFTASAKFGNTWKDGTALYYALNEDQIARPLGQWLARQSSALLRMFTWGSLSVEFAALPLILAPLAQPWLRRLAMVCLALLHLGIALTTTLGFFSLTMVTTYALLLLPEDWQLISRIGTWPVIARLIRFGRDLLVRRQPAFSRWFQPIVTSNAGYTEAAAELNWPARARFWALTLATTVLFLTFALDAFNRNLAHRLGSQRIPQPRWMRALIQASLLQQDWELFAPDPIRDDGWWVISGETESGDLFDPLTGKPPNFEKPPDLSAQYDRFWRKYLQRLWFKKNHDYRLYFGKYITRLNHREAPSGRRLTRFSFYYVKETTPPPGTPQPWPTERVLLWRHECFPKGEPAPQPEPDDFE